jgi:EPS_sugtrans: exopolysaccharide biosynthesis polyprenyl glycosylphosphotransferase
LRWLERQHCRGCWFCLA